MPFDLDTWKVRMPAQLRGWRKRMQKAKVESVYAFLAAATLWPVVQAARQGDWSALTVLVEVVSWAERHVLIERLPSGRMKPRQLVRLPRSSPVIKGRSFEWNRMRC